MNLLDLMVKVSVDDQASKKIGPLSDGLKTKLSTAAKAGAVALAAVTSAAIGMTKALMDNVHNVAEYGDNIDKMSQKLGLSTDAYQRWSYVLSQAGVDIDSMQTGLKTLTNQIDEAKNGSADAQARFEKLGLSLQDLDSMSREEVFEAVIRGFQGMSDSTERAALANDLFGKSGQNLTPLFNESIENTEELMAAAERLGFVMSEDSVKASAAYVDSLDTMNRAISGAKNAMLVEFLPGFTTLMDGITELISGDMEKGQELVEQGTEQIVQTIQEVGPKVMDVISRIADAAAPVLIEALGILITAMAKEIIVHIPDITQASWTLFLGIVEGFANGIAPAMEKVNEFVQGVLDAIGAFFGNMFQAGVDLITNIVDGARDTGDSMLQFVNELIEGAIAAIVGFFTNMLDTGKSLIDNLLKGATQVGKNIPKTFGNWIRSGLSAITGFLGSMLSAGTNLWNNLKRGAAAIGDTIASTFGGWIQSGLSNILGFLGSMLNAGVNLISNLLNGAVSIGRTIASTVSGWISSAVSNVLGFVGSMFSAGTSIISNLLNGAVSIGSTIASTVSGWISSAVSQVLNFGSAFYNAGSSILGGLIDGIRDGFGRAVGAVSDGLANIRSYLPFSPAKKGPFSGRGWTLYSGQAMMEGLAEGIEAASSTAERSMVGAIADVHDAMNGYTATSSLPVSASYARMAGSDAVIAWLSENLGDIIADYTPVMSRRDFDRMARGAVA